MSITPITDVTTIALGFLLSQFDEAPNLRALLALLTRSFQSLEDDGFFLITMALLSNATDAYLDLYGVIVGVPRDGRPDAEYRALISTRIASNNNSGTIESIITLIALLAGGAVKYDPLYPACYQLQLFPPAFLTAAQIADIAASLAELTPAGVCYIATQVPAVDPFTFDVGPGFDVGHLGGSIVVVP